MTFTRQYPSIRRRTSMDSSADDAEGIVISAGCKWLISTIFNTTAPLQVSTVSCQWRPARCIAFRMKARTEMELTPTASKIQRLRQRWELAFVPCLPVALTYVQCMWERVGLRTGITPQWCGKLKPCPPAQNAHDTDVIMSVRVSAVRLLHLTN